MSVSYTTVQDAIYDWIAPIVAPVQVIWARPNEAPTSDINLADEFVTLNLTGVLNKIGQDNLEFDSGTTYNIKGQRTANLSIIAYGATAQQMAIDIQSSSERPSVLEAIRSTGLAIWNEPNVTDLSAVLESGFENRAGIEFLLGISSLITDDVGIIERVTGEGCFNDGDIVQPIDIDTT